MSYGNPRQPSTFTVGGIADENLAQQLALYKPVATIRDMKQVYFYAGVNAGICWVHPLRFLNPVDKFTGPGAWTGWGNIMTPEAGNLNPNPKFVSNPWYLPLGTERKLDISNIVNDLLDIRVPKDKYLLEINLVECNIETDTANWQRIQDFVFYQGTDPATGLPNAPLSTQPTYVRNVEYGAPTNGVKTFINAAYEATKVTTPETLFVRIKELCNNEPYNWSVTNTGQYTLDKSHQLLVRHGDINYATLTLQFGHLVFTGRDEDEEQIEGNFVNTIKGATGYRRPTDPPLPLPSSTLQQNARKTDFKYLDYNSEVFNAIGTPRNVPGGQYDAPDTSIDGYYINEYKTGYYEQRPTPTGRDSLIQPANRPPFILSPDATLGGLTPSSENPLLAQGMPLRSNQQAKSIFFRFMVRVIHLF